MAAFDATMVDLIHDDTSFYQDALQMARFCLLVSIGCAVLAAGDSDRTKLPVNATFSSHLERGIPIIASRYQLRPIETAHLNFHFGNVLYDEATEQVAFIDPDYSVRGIDPLFGLSRFVFSFWHELATEIVDAVKIVPMSNSVLFVIRNDEHRRILEGIPELRGMSGLFGWLDPAEIPKFYALTVYCFLRSMRINGTGRPWVAPEHPMAARPEDVLLLGCLLFLEGFQTRSG
ncbi:hypothetical protein [Rhodopseudomonas sp. BR0M22]|uniref:hypothetical protein n=1 Tax=Rhodopseudomonas sp. BR0M22 TaxID=2269369 RepID=UPI0013E00985|nr:hypothetical protein [Rhodopseudomonas sp. BR0M22]NEW91011.1 hypothetical protein [Rhodopseudomonas sp. BR0M22]